MIVKRYGRLINSDITTGNILSLELHEPDIEDLVNPRYRYTTARFMEFRNPVRGWQPEDKIHVWLKSPELPEDNDKIANLHLDPGGDLYFTIWQSERLKTAATLEQFRDLGSFVTNDPENTLQRVGIEAIDIFNLSFLARVLRQNIMFPRPIGPF